MGKHKKAGKAKKDKRQKKGRGSKPLPKDSHHAYLNAIGIKSTDYCVFNSWEDTDERQKRFAKQRERHSFDERETWSFEYTLATWMYEHLMMYRDIACVDLTFWKFKVREPRLGDDGHLTYKKKVVTEDKAIRIACKCLQKSLQSEWDDELRDEYLYAAMRIVCEILPALWW